MLKYALTCDVLLDSIFGIFHQSEKRPVVESFILV